MSDLLVKLYEVEEDRALMEGLRAAGITVGKPIGAHLRALREWFAQSFGEDWLGEFEVAFFNRPRSCFVAWREAQPIGFACYDATALGFFGPIGVEPAHRGRGAGRALLLAALLDMRAKGYGYAIIGDASAPELYRRVGAVAIEDSDPGLYRKR